MTRFQVLDLLEPELAGPLPGRPVEDVEQVADVVAGVEALDDVAGQPPGAVLQPGDTVGSGCPPARANLSTSSPVVVPKRAASSIWSRAGKCTSRVDARYATRAVRFFFDSQTTNRGGSMLHWATKPTRHPARSSPSPVVTIAIG